MDISKQEAAARVAALRHNAGGTYTAASRETGIHYAQLSGWQRGLHKPNRRSMQRLREATS